MMNYVLLGEDAKLPHACITIPRMGHLSSNFCRFPEASEAS